MSTVGIVGGGQLARMLALSGLPLGLRFVFLDPAADACAAAVGQHLHGRFDDQELLERLADASDVITYETENVPASSVALLAQRRPVYPGSLALGTARDRLHEKTLFGELGIPTPPYAAVDTREDLDAAVAQIGLPAVLKTRTLGYDGKGQAVLRQAEDVAAAWQRLGGVPLILEGFVSFQREVSIVSVRGRDGAMAFYPLSENVHRGGILHSSHCREADPSTALARDYATRLLTHFDYVGVLALELFEADGQLLANEMAPRVHNSGHWTIEGAQTSQFENHLRAILGLPLGSTDPLGCTAMLNLIGELPASSNAVLAVPGAHLHVYDKAPAPGRKLGHVTLRSRDPESLDGGLRQLEGLIAPDGR